MNPCTCRNQHQPDERGYLYTDPGCHVHGMTVYQPSPQQLEAERLQEKRDALRMEIVKSLIKAKQIKKRSGARLPNDGPVAAAANRTQLRELHRQKNIQAQLARRR